MGATPFTTIQTLAAAAAASINTNPAATTTQIASILLHNSTAATTTAQLFIVSNNAGAVGVSALTNRIANINLAANETVEVPLKFPITLGATNDALFAQAGAANSVNVLLSGVRNT